LRTQPLFKCPNCTTRYHVVQVEADPSTNVEIDCLVCDQPLRSRDGRFILKYFLLDGPRRVRQQVQSGCVPHANTGVHSNMSDVSVQATVSFIIW
jgi:hypothetical protein